eukprot:Seg2772.1 transcript_id=Seg2772.1/GoldUCD/mRNA.D3Y31 product="hypothetical protein" protein_id=Seg2772.1/GoldUCD/D3Y31
MIKRNNMKKQTTAKQVMKTYWNLSDDDSEFTQSEYSIESSSSSDDEIYQRKTRIFIGNAKLMKHSTSSKPYITDEQQKRAQISRAKFVNGNTKKANFAETVVRSNRPVASTSKVRFSLPKVSANEMTRKRSVATITIRSPVSSNGNKGNIQEEVGHVPKPSSTVKTLTKNSLTAKITSNDAKGTNDIVKNFPTAENVAKYPSITKLEVQKTSPITLVRINNKKADSSSEFQANDKGSHFSHGNNDTTLSLDESFGSDSMIAEGDSILINGDSLILNNDSRMTNGSDGNRYSYQSKSVMNHQPSHSNHSDSTYLSDRCDQVVKNQKQKTTSPNTNSSKNIEERVSTNNCDEGSYDYQTIYGPDQNGHGMRDRHVLLRSTKIQETKNNSFNDFHSTNISERRSSSEESWPSPPADNFLTESITLQENDKDAIGEEISVSFDGQLSAAALITSSFGSAIKGDVQSMTSNGQRDENANYVEDISSQQPKERQGSPYFTVLRQTYRQISSCHGKNDASEITTSKGEKYRNNDNGQQSNIEAGNDTSKEHLKTKSLKTFNENFTAESRGEKMSTEYKLPKTENEAGDFMNGNSEGLNVIRDSLGRNHKRGSYSSEHDRLVSDEHYNDDESCILCEIMSNEERLTRRSVDMDSFRKSALNDCDKVLKKMKHAQKIVRKLSGGESPRKLLNNEIMRSLPDRNKSQQMINSSIQHVPDHLDKEPNTVPTEQRSEDSDPGKSKTVARETIFCLTGPRTIPALNASTLNAELRNFNKILIEGKHDWNVSAIEVQPSHENETKAAHSSSKVDNAINKPFTHEEDEPVTLPQDGTLHARHDIHAPQDEIRINSNDKDMTSRDFIAPYEAARRHCVELIDSGGYLIPQPSMKKQSKARKRLTEDFEIVESMPCSQVIEPRYHSFHSESSDVLKAESDNSQMQNYQAEENFQQSPFMTDQNHTDGPVLQQAAYLQSRCTASVDCHQTPQSESSQSQRSQATRSQENELQSPQSNSSRSQATRSYSPQSQPSPLPENKQETTTTTTDSKRAEREASWLKKAMRRLRRSLSFEDDRKSAVTAQTQERRPTIKASNSSGNIPADAFTERDSRGRSYSDDEGRRGNSGHRGSSVKGIRQMHNYHSAGRYSQRQHPSKVPGHKIDPEFHPKYGFAPGISQKTRAQKNSKAQAQSPDGKNSYNFKQIQQTNNESGHCSLNYSRKQRASNNMYFGSNPQVQSILRFDEKETLSPQKGYERNNPFMAPLEIKMASQKKAAKKHFRSKR